MKNVLIVGCGRSGTSIFGELFETLPGYQYFSEPDFDDLLMSPPSAPFAVKVPRESKLYECTPGLSFPNFYLPKLLGNSSKIYWIVRHPYDAVASLRVGIAQNWGHHPRPSDWELWLKRSLIEQCAHHWSYINSVGYSAITSVIEVCKFEEMVLDPAQFANKVAWDIGGNPDLMRSALDTWASRVQNTNNESFIEAKTSRFYSRKDHTCRVGRWKENLSQAEISLIRPLVEEAANSFGYRL